MTLSNPSRRRFGRHALALAGLPLLPSCILDTATTADYVDAVQSAIDTYGLPGVLAGVRVADQTPWMDAFGKANVANRVALGVDCVFPIRSITKSFTVTLVLQLVRDGALALDHTIGRYVAGVPNGNLITLADLAGNQSGLVDYSGLDGFQKLFVADPQRVWTEQELVAFALVEKPAFLPGEQYQYSNTNTVLLGMVVETVTGLTLGPAMAERILNPLALADTAYPAQATLPDPHPTPYALNLVDGALDEQPLISPTSLAGSGALISSLADLMHWGDALGDGRLIGTTLQGLRKSTSRLVTNGPEYTRYGLGIGQIGSWWGHTGSGVGFQVATMNDAAADTTISVMVNATPDGGRPDLNFAQVVFEALANVVASH